MKSQLVLYPEFDLRIERDYLYTVSVTQGARTEPLPVYNHTEPSRVDRNPVDDKRTDSFRRFSTFAFSGEGVRIDIRVNRDFHDYAVIPSAKHFKHCFRDGVISVYLDHPDYFAIRLDGKDHTILSIFTDEPESDIPQPGEHTIVVAPWQEVNGGVLRIRKPNTTVYIPAGAVLCARVEILADNCRVIGRGAILDPVGDIYRYDASKLDTGVVLLVKAANHTRIEGIHLLNAKAFNIEVIGKWKKTWAVDNRIRNVKILSTQMCTDGITFCYYSRDSYAEHCFVYCGDNALVYEEYAHYKDMTIGTTCNAIFPQTDVVDSSVEDISVFRADEGIINCEYCGENGITKIENHMIRNLDAVDVTYTPYFLFVEVPTKNPVVSARNGLTIENVRFPLLSDTGTPVFFNNIAAGDYAITLKNLSIGGNLIHEISPEATGGEVTVGSHTFRYLTDENFDPSLPQNRVTVDYKTPVNVLVGSYQIFFSAPVLCEGDEILLPAKELKAELRTTHMGKAVWRNKTKYVSLSDLVRSGMAKAIERTGNRIIITPNDPHGNLFLPDHGIISKFTEHICYASHLVVRAENGKSFYRTINTSNHDAVGIFRLIDEEIKKYGEGIYRLSFAARASRAVSIRSAFSYHQIPNEEKSFAISLKWKNCSMDVRIGSEHLRQSKIALIISNTDGRKGDFFDVKNIRLVKTE